MPKNSELNTNDTHKGSPRKKVAAILAILGVCLIGAGLWLIYAPTSPLRPSDGATATDTVELLPDPHVDLVGRLFITEARKNYKAGDLVLVIPRMGLNVPVQDGTTSRQLAKGPGLYRYSQLPGNTPNGVAITAHRDISGKEFYFIDRLGEGDLFYLIYEGKLYTYLYRETTVVEAGDWSPIAHPGKAQLSILSSTPLGTSLQRMVVVSDLIAISEAPEDAGTLLETAATPTE